VISIKGFNVLKSSLVKACAERETSTADISVAQLVMTDATPEKISTQE
jgi:hypothetical protein